MLTLTISNAFTVFNEADYLLNRPSFYPDLLATASLVNSTASCRVFVHASLRNQYPFVRN